MSRRDTAQGRRAISRSLHFPHFAPRASSRRHVGERRRRGRIVSCGGTDATLQMFTIIALGPWRKILDKFRRPSARRALHCRRGRHTLADDNPASGRNCWIKTRRTPKPNVNVASSPPRGRRAGELLREMEKAKGGGTAAIDIKQPIAAPDRAASFHQDASRIRRNAGSILALIPHGNTGEASNGPMASTSPQTDLGSSSGQRPQRGVRGTFRQRPGRSALRRT